MNKYGRAWKRIRDKYSREHPNCEICGEPTEEVHHIVPLCDGGDHRRENLMALCPVCHVRVHTYLRITSEKEKKRGEDYCLRSNQDTSCRSRRTADFSGAGGVPRSLDKHKK